MWHVQVLCLEVERLNQEDILSTFRDSLQSQQSNNSDLRDRLIQLEQVESSLDEYVHTPWSIRTRQSSFYDKKVKIT